MQSNSILSELFNSDSQLTLHQLQKKQKTKKETGYINHLNYLLPRTTLDSLRQIKQYAVVEESPLFSVYQKAKCAYKLVIRPKVPFNKQNLTSVILNDQKYSKWNSNITQLEIKHSFPSENFQVLYQKNKSQGTFWKSRDFVFVRHVLKYKDNVYIIDKSIHNESYPPYVTLTRGEYFAVWGLFLNDQKPEVVINLMMRNEGNLSDDNERQLQMAYIKEFKNLCPYAEKQQKALPKLYNIDWDITQSQISRQLEDIDLDQEDIDGNLDTHSEDDDINPTRYQFNQNSQIIVPCDYISAKFQQNVLPATQPIYFTSKKGHFIWKDQWKRDKAKGGMIFTEQFRIKRSRNVLKYLMKKMGKNFLTGKSILNISLPVNIFSRTSNLEHLATGFAYAPLFLEKASQIKNPIEQIKEVVLFAITNPIAFITMQKPFNPILGQTFQGWVNGCPVYLQQISHHPPIASVLFIGRGYKIYASLESKAQISMNSGIGSTDGVYKIVFDDGTDYNFRSPGGQISGTMLGDRKFNYVGKSWLWSKKHSLFLQLTYDPDKKGFLSLSKKQTTSDYFAGQIVNVQQNFMSNIGQKSGKSQLEYLSSYNKHVKSKVGKVDGIWPLDIRIDDKPVFDISKDLPYRLQVQKHLLPSDCSWREDVAFRKLRNYPKAQQQKQILENKQRNDAKLRKQHKK